MIIVAFFADFPGPHIILNLNFAHSQIISEPNGKEHIVQTETENPRLQEILANEGATQIYISEAVVTTCRLQTTTKEVVLVPS